MLRSFFDTSLQLQSRSRLLLVCGALLGASACSDAPPSGDGGAGDGAITDAASPVDAGSDAGSDGSIDGSAGEGGSEGGMVRLRVAHLSPNAPAVDVCIKARDAADYTGAPTLQGLGVAAGLRYPQVTRYLEVPAGTYNVRVVAAGSTSCATPLLPALADIATLPALTAGATVTVAATGIVGGTPGFALTPFVDNASAPAAGNFKLRFLHTGPGIAPVDVGLLGAGDAFTGLFNGVAYGTGAAATEGYVTAPAASGVTIAARVAGTTPANRSAYPLVLEGVDLPSGANLTAFAIGQNTDTAPLQALVCNDGAAPMGALSACSVLPPRVFVRVAHLSPDAPAVDFCLRAGNSGPFAGPVLEGAGVAAGASFASVTRYFALAPGAYTVRLVAADASNCDTSLAGLPEYTLPALTAGTWATVAAVGQVGAMPRTFELRPFVDTHDVPAAGKIHLRFVHASPGTPPVDVGTVSAGALTPVWSNTAFGSAGSIAGMTDANGFLPTSPLMNATLGVRLTGQTAIALTIPSVTLEAFSVRSIFAIGLASGSGATRLSALLCDDRAAATNGVASCARVP